MKAIRLFAAVLVSLSLLVLVMLGHLDPTGLVWTMLLPAAAVLATVLPLSGWRAGHRIWAVIASAVFTLLAVAECVRQQMNGATPLLAGAELILALGGAVLSVTAFRRRNRRRASYWESYIQK